MKNISPVVRSLIWTAIGCLAGVLISALVLSGVFGERGHEVCFFAGMAVVILGLFSCLKGNPRNSTVGFGDKGYFNAYVVMDEEKNTKAMEKYYRQNHVLNITPFSFCLLFTGIAMAIMAHLAAIGKF